MVSRSKHPPRVDGVYVSRGTTDEVFTPRARAAQESPNPRLPPRDPSVVTDELLRPSARPTPPGPGPRTRASVDVAAPRRADPRRDGGSPSVEERVSAPDMRAPRRPPTIPAPALANAPDPRLDRAGRLCDELTRCGPGDEAPFVARFRALAEVGVAALERAFPGLLWFDRNLPHQRPPQGRAVSPVASILVAIGLDAVPSVARLLHNDHEDIRYYAALVAIDMRAPALVPVLGELLFDEDLAVRDLALEALVGMRDSDACHLVCRSLERRVSDPKWPAQRRTLAIRALAALRWPGAVLPLVTILELLEPGTPERARLALRTLTAHDFGLREKDWRKWHEKHGHEPRKGWMLLALVGQEPGLRDFAAAELVRITGLDHGYVPGADLKECKRLQKLYAQG